MVDWHNSKFQAQVLYLVLLTQKFVIEIILKDIIKQTFYIVKLRISLASFSSDFVR